MKITIRRFGMSPAELLSNIEFKFLTIEKGLTSVGDEARDLMRDLISSSKKRGATPGNLENSIETQVEKNPFLVGVGLIALLDAKAPYWYFLNYGISRSGMTIPGRGKAVPGFFGAGNAPDSSLAGTAKGTEPFYYVPRGISTNRFIMRPKNPISPVHYLEKMNAAIERVWKVHFYDWTKNIKVHVT